MLYLECYKKDVNYQNISLKSKENKKQKIYLLSRKIFLLGGQFIKGFQNLLENFNKLLMARKKQGWQTLLFLINVISYLSRDKVF